MKKTLMIIAVAWFSFGFITSVSFAQTVNAQPVSEADHFRHPMKDKFYTETWNYHIMLDSGEIMSLSYGFSNLGVTSGSALVQFTLTPSDSDPISVKDELSQSSYHENRKTGSIIIGPHSIVLKENVSRLSFSKKETKVDLTIHPWTPGFQVDNATTIINKEKGQFYRSFVEIPRGDVEGTLTVQGVPRPIKGAVYMDHSVSNVLPVSYSSHWYSLRAFFPDYTVALLEFQYLPKTGGGRWELGFVTNRERILGISTDYKVDVSGDYKDKSCSVPTSFDVRMSAGTMSLIGHFKSSDPYCCIPILEDLNWLTRKVANTFIGNPTVCRSRSNADLRLTLSDQTVHLEGPAYQGVVSMGN